MSNKPPMIELPDGREEPLDLSKSEHLLAISQDEILTLETWEDEKVSVENKNGCNAYGVGQLDMVNVLVTLLEMKLSGKELTKQIQGLIANRKIFCDHALEYEPL